MSHENSITIQKANGKWVNISSLVKGKHNPRRAEQMFKAGRRGALGGKSFSTVGAAVKAASARSKSFNGARK